MDFTKFSKIPGMKKTVVFILFMLFISAPAGNVCAGVAEASTGMENRNLEYDLSGLNGEERKWFRTFLEGTFFADGWEQITDHLLQHFSSAEREQQRLMLTKLGNKIGREWSRANEVRKIDTAMLKKWGNRLRTTASEEPNLLSEVIRTIDREVETLLD
jgi:hypothetical protein